MKKSLIIFAFILLAGSLNGMAQGIQVVNNSASCDYIITILAHDCTTCTNNAHCALASNHFSLKAGHTVSFASVANINAGSGGPGWQGGVSATGGAGSGGDGVDVENDMVPPTVVSVGVNACITTNTTASITNCSPTGNVVLTTFMSGIKVTIND